MNDPCLCPVFVYPGFLQHPPSPSHTVCSFACLHPDRALPTPSLAPSPLARCPASPPAAMHRSQEQNDHHISDCRPLKRTVCPSPLISVLRRCLHRAGDPLHHFQSLVSLDQPQHTHYLLARPPTAPHAHSQPGHRKVDDRMIPLTLTARRFLHPKIKRTRDRSCRMRPVCGLVSAATLRWGAREAFVFHHRITRHDNTPRKAVPARPPFHDLVHRLYRQHSLFADLLLWVARCAPHAACCATGWLRGPHQRSHFLPAAANPKARRRTIELRSQPSAPSSFPPSLAAAKD